MQTMDTSNERNNPSENNVLPLSFPFRDRRIPVTYVSSVKHQEALMAILSEPFTTWYRRCERVSPQNSKRLELHEVTIQSVDMFGPRKVGFIKIISHSTLFDGVTHQERRLPGICFLRGNAVSIFVSLFCIDAEGSTADNDNNNTSVTKSSEYCLLVEQPRVPIGAASVLELPAGMIDDDQETVAGIAVKEMEEECGIQVRPSDLIDLTDLALGDTVRMGNIPIPALAPSPGGCDEFLRYMYLEKKVTLSELNEMKGRLAGLRAHGEYITLTVVPKENAWRISGDSKVMISLFLIEQLRREGKLPPAGQLATCLRPSNDTCNIPTPKNLTADHKITLNDGSKIPLLGYGMYQVPADDIGEKAILNAIDAGYRHFDGAAFYGNEKILGQALLKSGIPREDFIIGTKVWKDSLRGGREAVRKSLMNSINELNFGGYFDICYIHWPVPGLFVDAYRELQLLYSDGKVRSIGLSNFTPQEYEELITSAGITVLPVVNQIEVSAVMYRPELVAYFQNRNIRVVAYKPLNRGGTAFECEPIQSLAKEHSVSPAQIMLKWCLQKGLIVVCKSLTFDHMRENRSIFHFSLSEDNVAVLDSLTTDNDRLQKDQHELKSKQSL